MNDKSYVITSKQLTYIIVGATIGVGLLTLPDTVGREAKQDTWMAVGIGALLPLAGLFSITLMASRMPNLTLAEYAERVLGKWLGKLLTLFFIFYTIAYAALVARIFVNVLKIYLFPNTPAWALVGLILALAAYLASKDVRVLGRVNELIFWEAEVLFFSLLMAIPNIDFTFYRPVGDVGLINILKGGYQATFAFLGMEILLVVYPLVQRKKDVFRAGVAAIGIVCAIYFAVVLTTLGVFGPDVIGKIRFSLMVLLKTYEAPLIERAEFFFIVFYVFIAFQPVATMYFAGRFTTEKFLGLQSPGRVTLALFPVILGVALLPQSFEGAIAFSSRLSMLGFVFLIIVPLVLWAVAGLRGIGGGKGDA